MGTAFLMSLAIAISIGWLAQTKKGRTGAAWGALTFILTIPAWFLLYIGVYGALSEAGPVYFERTSEWIGVGIVVALVVALPMALVVMTLPNRRLER